MKKRTIILIIVLIIFSIAVTPKAFENDLFTAIRCGNEIMQNGLHANGAYVWHEGIEFDNIRWLFDLIVTLIHNNFGNFALYVLNIIFVFLYVITTYIYSRKKGYSELYSFFAAIVFMILFRQLVSLRAQIMSYLLVVFEYFILEALDKNGKNIYIFLLFIISILIANLHGSMFIFYLIMFLPYIAEGLLHKLKIRDTKKIEIGDNKHYRKILLAFLVSIIGGFINPNFEAPFVYLIRTSFNISYLSIITELKPLNISNSTTYICWIAIIVMTIIVTDKKIRLKNIFYFLGFLTLTLSAVRMGAFLVISTFFWVSDLFHDYITKNELNIGNKHLKTFIIVSIILIIVLLSVASIIEKMFKRYIDTDVFPVDVANYILTNLDYKNIRIYNSFNTGSYLEMMEIPAFIDSRPEMYTKSFNNTDLFKDYVLLTSGKKSYREIFKTYDITHVLMEKDNFLNKSMEYDDHLKIIYQDDIFVLYEVVEKY